MMKRYGSSGLAVLVTGCVGFVLWYHRQDVSTLVATTMIFATCGLLWSVILTIRELQTTDPESSAGRFVQSTLKRTAIILFLAMIALDHALTDAKSSHSMVGAIPAEGNRQIAAIHHP